MAVLLAVILAVIGFFGYRDEVPRWVFGLGHPTATMLAAPLPPLDPDAVAATVEPQLVNVTVSVRSSGFTAAGSGIVLTADGQVLTSHHVIKDAKSITVDDLGTGDRYSATVQGYDADADVALLALSRADALPVARIGRSGQLRLGDELLALGNAGGTGRPTATPGTVEALGSSIAARDAVDFTTKALTGMVEVAAPVTSGQSGGAVADCYGSVVGVVTAATGELARAAGRPAGYAVPIDRAMNIVRQIRSGMSTETVHVGPTATLGVVTTDEAPAGARVRTALSGMPAAGAGVAAGDLITGIDGRAISSVRALRDTLTRHRPHDTVHLELTGRDGAARTVAVALGAGPPA